jgi:hypothetical protein
MLLYIYVCVTQRAHLDLNPLNGGRLRDMWRAEPNIAAISSPEMRAVLLENSDGNQNFGDCVTIVTSKGCVYVYSVSAVELATATVADIDASSNRDSHAAEEMAEQLLIAQTQIRIEPRLTAAATWRPSPIQQHKQQQASSGSASSVMLDTTDPKENMLNLSKAADGGEKIGTTKKKKHTLRNDADNNAKDENEKHTSMMGKNKRTKVAFDIEEVGDVPAAGTDSKGEASWADKTTTKKKKKKKEKEKTKPAKSQGK